MRRKRFTLRTLMGLVALVCCFMAVHVSFSRGYRSDARVITDMEDIYVQVNLPITRRIPCPPRGTNGLHAQFDYRGIPIARKLITALDLRYSCRVTRIYLNGTVFTDDSLESLAALPHLRRVTLRGTRISDAAIEELKTKLPEVSVVRIHQGKSIF